MNLNISSLLELASLPSINQYALFQDDKNLPSGFLYSFTNLPFINKQAVEKDKSPGDLTDDHLKSRKKMMTLLLCQRWSMAWKWITMKSAMVIIQILTICSHHFGPK
jgi:hypothetical protein